MAINSGNVERVSNSKSFEQRACHIYHLPICFHVLPVFYELQLQDYKSELIQNAEQLLVEGFPMKIMQLNDILTSKDFVDREFKLDYGIVETNSQVSYKVDKVKPLIRQLFEDVNLLKMWINLVVPKIADGHNFGVEIQLETLNEIKVVERKAAAYFNQISHYFKLRADLVSAAEYKPDIQDFTRAVQETDENEFFNMTLMLREIQNHYTSLHDMISKNMDKLKKPRPSSFDHILY